MSAAALLPVAYDAASDDHLKRDLLNMFTGVRSTCYVNAPLFFSKAAPPP